MLWFRPILSSDSCSLESHGALNNILGKQCDLIMGNSRGASDIAWENSPHSPRRDLDEGVSVEMVRILRRRVSFLARPLSFSRGTLARVYSECR